LASSLIELSDPEPAAPRIGAYRWRILALLFVATTINYVDRSVLGVLAPTLQYRVFHWSDQDYAWINIAFKSAYAIGLVCTGSVIDRIGTRLGYSLSVAVWCTFSMLHALVRPAFSVLGFSAARFGLGLGESGNFPAGIKAIAEWFPQRDRAFATGIFNSGTTVGAITAPILVPMIVHPDGTHWQYAFLVTGAFSLTWLFFWHRMYRPPASHPLVSAEELSLIHDGALPEAQGARIPWRRLLAVRESWGFAIAKVTDAAWWFYLFWGGKYLYDRFGLDIKSLALPLVVIYAASGFGSVGGGWISSALIVRGWPVNRARKSALLGSALFILPVVLVTVVPTRFNADQAFYGRLAAARYRADVEVRSGGSVTLERELLALPDGAQADLRSLSGRSFASAKEFTAAASAAMARPMPGNMESVLVGCARSDSLYWVAVLLMALATAGHQAWSANLFTIVSDVFPKSATASLTGFGGMFGAVAGLLADWGLGRVLSTSGPVGYLFAFLAAGSVYLFCFGILQALIPHMTPLDNNLKHKETNRP
jgi:ACS family hexuronate transporter-like MFS transporter